MIVLTVLIALDAISTLVGSHLGLATRICAQYPHMCGVEVSSAIVDLVRTALV